MSVVIAKISISILLLIALTGILLLKKKITQWLESHAPEKILALGWFCFRLLPFVAIYLLAGMSTTSDVNGFWDEGSKASRGMVVYRDFWSPYSPLYPYLLALGLKLWYNPKMIVLMMVLMDGVAVWLSWHFYRPLQSKGTFLFRALIYFLLPGSLIMCVIAAQEDVWMWTFVVLAYLVRVRTGRVEWYALFLALGLLWTKAIFVLILAPLFIYEKQKIRFAIPIALVGIISISILYPLVGLEFMQPMDEAQTLRAPNIPAIINPWFYNTIGVGESFWNSIGLLIPLGLASLAAYRLRESEFKVMVSRVWIVLYATIMVTQQSAYSNYIFLFLIPMVFCLINWNNGIQTTLFLVFNVLCTIHPSYWWRLGMPCYRTPLDIISSTELLCDYLMQVSIVILTGYFVWLAFPKSTTTGQPISATRP